MKNITCLILGAGFSYSSGLPLTNQIFDEVPIPPDNNPRLCSIYVSVKNEWEKWKSLNGDNPELWLKELYFEQNVICPIKFADAADFMMARLTNIPVKYGRNGAYYYGISTSIQNKDHQNFWRKIRCQFNIKSIITTNYDIVIEQGLRTDYSSSSNNRLAPDCRYGGFPASFEQKIKIKTGIKKGIHREDILKGDIELFKLHGSINWVAEPHEFKIHDDVRAVYRLNRDLGKPNLIPPMLEKQRPDWAFRIWEYAEKRLAEADIWFICGYSLPEYDVAIQSLLTRACSNKKYLKIYLADPCSKALSAKWKNLVKCNNEIVTLNGLPELLDELTA